jgi:protein-tyrosine phosphatase
MWLCRPPPPSLLPRPQRWVIFAVRPRASVPAYGRYDPVYRRTAQARNRTRDHQRPAPAHLWYEDRVPRIVLQGAVNVRDLGGIATASGRKLMPGQVFRGDSLSKLTDADLRLLAGLGPRTVIDFRSEPEITHLGADRLPPGAIAVDLPVSAGDLMRFIAAIGDVARQRELLGDGRAARFMLAMNRDFVSQDAHREQFATALRLIADDARRPVLYHCTAGKDRTGWMTALLLTALGVPRETVVADYLATNEYAWPAFEKQLRPLAALGQLDLNVFKPLLVQEPAYLDAAFDEVTVRYGTFENFLTGGLGFDTGDVERLRAALLG